MHTFSALLSQQLYSLAFDCRCMMRRLLVWSSFFPPASAFLSLVLLLLQELYNLAFDYRYMMRGLVIDKRRGNMLKVDRHK